MGPKPPVKLTTSDDGGSPSSTRSVSPSPSATSVGAPSSQKKPSKSVSVGGISSDISLKKTPSSLSLTAGKKAGGSTSELPGVHKPKKVAISEPTIQEVPDITITSPYSSEPSPILTFIETPKSTKESKTPSTPPAPNTLMPTDPQKSSSASNLVKSSTSSNTSTTLRKTPLSLKSPKTSKPLLKPTKPLTTLAKPLTKTSKPLKSSKTTKPLKSSKTTKPLKRSKTTKPLKRSKKVRPWKRSKKATSLKRLQSAKRLKTTKIWKFVQLPKTAKPYEPVKKWKSLTIIKSAPKRADWMRHRSTRKFIRCEPSPAYPHNPHGKQPARRKQTVITFRKKKVSSVGVESPYLLAMSKRKPFIPLAGVVEFGAAPGTFERHDDDSWLICLLCVFCFPCALSFFT